MNRNKHFTLNIPLPTRQTLGRALRWLLPNGGTLILLALFLFAQSVGAIPLPVRNAAPAWPAAPTINYQGRLADSAGNPINDTVAMQFALYDAATDGSVLWGPESHPTISVSDGLFSVGLGSQTSGGIPTSVLSGDVWLEITVDGETLAPREQLRAVPYAMQASVALTVPDGSIGTNQIADGAVTRDKAPGLLGAQSDNVTTKWGNVVLTTDANGEGHISFTEPFPNATYVVVANNGDRGAADFTIQIDGMGTPGFDFKLYRVDGTVLSNRMVRIFYIAVGH